MADSDVQWTGKERRTEVRLRELLGELIDGMKEVRRELAVQAVAIAQLRVEIDVIKQRQRP